MTAQPEIRHRRPLRILSDLFSLVALGAGGFGLMAVLLAVRGWTPRGDLEGARAMLAETAVAVIWAFGPLLTGVASFILIALGILALFSGRRANVLWLALTLAVGAVLLQPSSHQWIDTAILIALVAGWCAQAIPQRKPATQEERVAS